MPAPHPQSASALAAAAIIQLSQIGMLLTPDRPTESPDPAKTKAARILIDGMIGDMQRIVDCDCTPRIVITEENGNILQFNSSVRE